MIIDSREHGVHTDYVYDICIIGAGAAGITAALELGAKNKLRVAVLEAGGESFSRHAQELYQGCIEGDRQPPLWRARYSGLGGSTEVWAGWCRPLESVDFEARDYLPYSGWPIGYADLESDYRRATEICGLSSSDFSYANCQHKLPGAPLPLAEGIEHHLYQVRSLRFSLQYQKRLEDAENIHLYLHAPVMRLCTQFGGDTVSHVELSEQNKSAGFKANASQLKAKRFILATGGVENARLLLLSGDNPGRAIGNQNDCVGRYFIDHGFIDSGWFIPGDAFIDLTHYFPVALSSDKQASVRPVISLSGETLRQEQMLNSALFFYPSYESHPAFSSEATKAALELWDIVKSKKLKELVEICRAEPARGDFLLYCKRIFSRPDAVAQALLRKLLVKGSCNQRWRTRYYYECVPSPHNRITLDNLRDKYNRPRAKLSWRLSEQDIDSAMRFHSLLEKSFIQTGSGRLTYYNTRDDWRRHTETGKHPSGSTRMHDNAAQGVVDKNCKVHGVNNLYIAGSSVFPTGGYANPTLTIVALTIRLVRHLTATDHITL